MKYLLFVFLIFFTNPSFADTKDSCEGILAKLKANCNIVGKGMKKMKEFSKENQTINQSIRNIKKKIK